MAAMPSVEAVKLAEEFYMSELLFTPVKAKRQNERSWKISLPAESGRKTRWGVTLILSEKTDEGKNKPPMPELSRVSLLAYTTRLRRLVHRNHINWYGNIPFFGTLFIQLFKKEAGLSWFPSGLSDLDKYTKSV
jgi:hypothetical protein